LINQKISNNIIKQRCFFRKTCSRSVFRIWSF